MDKWTILPQGHVRPLMTAKLTNCTSHLSGDMGGMRLLKTDEHYPIGPYEQCPVILKQTNNNQI